MAGWASAIGDVVVGGSVRVGDGVGATAGRVGAGAACPLTTGAPVVGTAAVAAAAPASRISVAWPSGVIGR